MSNSENASFKGARPKTKPPSLMGNNAGTSCNDNNNYHGPNVCRDEGESSDRLGFPAETLSQAPQEEELLPARLRLHETPLESLSRPRPNPSAATTSQANEFGSGRVKRPSDLAVNGHRIAPEPPVALPTNPCDASPTSQVPDPLDAEFSVLPRQLLQSNEDYCGLSEDCEVCGPKNISLVQNCTLNGHSEVVSGAGRLHGEDVEVDEEVEGAVGGQDIELLDRCSPDSGEGEFDNQNSRSPSCSWDQQSSSSGEECFYRYRGEDDAPPAALENLPNRGPDGPNAVPRQSSSPEMDYLEMDFDPSSSDWGGDDLRPAAPVVPEPDVPEPLVPPPPVVALPLAMAPPARSPQKEGSPVRPREPEIPATTPTTAVASALSTEEIYLWSQNCASELLQPFTTPLTSASNAIYYAMAALQQNVLRETIMAHLSEVHPPRAAPQHLVGYLQHRASHTTASAFSPASPILTGPDLARAVAHLSQGRLRARFFPIAARQLRDSGNLCSFIRAWMHRGMVPILTFSQAQSEGSRHEMVFGSTADGLLTMAEPYRQLSEGVLSGRLAGQGHVVVSRAEVLARWRRDQDLGPLLRTPSLIWATGNVLGCVVNILREATMIVASPSPSSPCASRQPLPQPPLLLPLLCEPGITLVCELSNPNCALLEDCCSFCQ